ncbi:hypothetical protein BDN72DRAFT_959469 [Pluteus cervinus]|uniref:Uncharacterized protein n=1 Tax=Pluteus cervinus TaxID=181527 RepID=A0ACD3AW87_9AGAR|nr:hypothetical protein BDN72DRAFT_959469 [Pluteus cervinus]
MENLQNDSSEGDLYPIFPPEIEHKIFVAAFDGDQEMSNIGPLLLVSKRVYEWLLPLVYEIVSTYPGSFKWPPMTLPIKNLPRFGKYVRHLLLDFTQVGTSAIYFTDCPNVVDLCLVGWDGTGLPTLPCLRPTELSVNLDEFPKVPEIIPFCTNVTHLDCAYDEWKHFIGPSNWFSYFPNLTHLMVRGDSLQDQREHVDLVFQQLQNLQVFILCHYPNSDLPGLKMVESDYVYPDPRIVHLSLRFPLHWKTAAQGILSPWLFAEEVVKKRRDGVI